MSDDSQQVPGVERPSLTPEARTHLIPFVILGLAAPLIASATIVGRTSLPAWWSDLALYLALGVFLFGCSTLFHVFEGTPLEESMNKLDHVGIHTLIAGTAAVHMHALPAIHVQRVPVMLCIVWGLALIGVLYRLARGKRAQNRIFMTIYGAMGLTVVPTIQWSADGLRAPAMLVALAAMAVYAASAAILFRRNHTWWHVGVVAGYVLAGAAIVIPTPA